MVFEDAGFSVSEIVNMSIVIHGKAGSGDRIACGNVQAATDDNAAGGVGPGVGQLPCKALGGFCANEPTIMSGGAIAGLLVSMLLLIAILAFVVWKVTKRNTKHNSDMIGMTRSVADSPKALPLPAAPISQVNFASLFMRFCCGHQYLYPFCSLRR
jgi:hypothetical protein